MSRDDSLRNTSPVGKYLNENIRPILNSAQSIRHPSCHFLIIDHSVCLVFHERSQLSVISKDICSTQNTYRVFFPLESADIVYIRSMGYSLRSTRIKIFPKGNAVMFPRFELFIKLVLFRSRSLSSLLINS